MLIPITNTPRNYDWGSRNAIAQLLAREPSGLPEAELWLGTHSGSPARIADPTIANGHTDLSDWMAANATDNLSAKLPFLLKILAAEHPLSLQVHPDTQQAQRGFARENEVGLPLDDPTRNYKDDQAKPEIIVAISDTFEALAGFKPAERSIEEISKLGPHTTQTLTPLIDRLLEGLQPAVEWILLSPQSTLDAPLQTLVQAVDNASPNTTIKLLAARYPRDRGLLLALLLRKVTLKRGGGLFLPARNIHAYLRGVGVELMRASDNVLRAGLTPKHVDPLELLSIVDFDETSDNRLDPTAFGVGVGAYQPPDVGFQIVRVDGTAPATVHLDGSAIAICLSGTTHVHGRHNAIFLTAGQCLFISPDEETISMTEGAELFIAMERTA
ncbi:mannose-6-phosphate isomerase, class I [Arthrobacter tecti]